MSLVFTSCSKNYNVTKIEGKQINISDKAASNQDIENYIAPFRKNIEKDLDSVLAYAPETLDKSKGEWQTTIGDFLANLTLQKANVVFLKREKKNIDICLLNDGGIRAILPKGNVTTRTAFEIMPFENTAIVIALKGEQIEEIANHIVTVKKPHPIAGLTFTIDKDNKVKNIKVKNEVLQLNRIYYVVTSDYLSNGGDNMDFFKKGVQSFDLNYKLRNILIDYLKDIDTIAVPSEIKIAKEN
ncbi:5'-nucleotidase C-terminal domain-containing protein [Flavobacterium sp.]|uniref:5'-nucleotidase C-terminal domain-containing protein n=1 Tax=Flavobacterium sp. TaxID=239 RepID=UPI00375258B7